MFAVKSGGTRTCAGEVGGHVDDNVLEMARVGAHEFQLNVKTGEDPQYGPSMSPFQSFAVAIGSIIA